MPRLTPLWIIAACSAAVIALVLGGCGSDDGLGPRYPLAGHVSYKGEPVDRAMVVFVPVNEGVSASGEVERGRFRHVTTRNLNDGILPGKYRVAIFPFPLIEGVPPAPAHDPKRGPRRPPETSQPAEVPVLRPVLTVKGTVLPERYRDLMNSGLEVEVTPATFAFDFDLHG